MKFIYFFRADNNFKDILTDPSIKPHIRTKIMWHNFLLVGIYTKANLDSVISYINLKYGDDIRTNIHGDFTPVPNKDYIIK